MLQISDIRGPKHKYDKRNSSLDIIHLKKRLHSLHSYIYNHYSIVNIYYISYSLTVGTPKGSLITVVRTLIQYNNCVIICPRTECAGGWYGQDCALLCGQCLNNEQCHHIDGRCLNGCQPGFQGDYCTHGKRCN